MSSYDDIIHLPHHVSQTHPAMSRVARAAQFAPFAALTGFEEVVMEAGRRTEVRPELDCQEMEMLDRKLKLLKQHLQEHPQIQLEYFVPDERKAGGCTHTVVGTVAEIIASSRLIRMTDGVEIPMMDILSLAGDLFDEEL